MESAAAVELKTDLGDAVLEHASGDARIAASGLITAGELEGAALIRNSGGDTRVRRALGALTVTASHGRVTVEAAEGDVEARSARGPITIASAARGTVTLGTAVGDIEVGIRGTAAAWLDVATRIGAVRSALAPAEGPDAVDDPVTVRARTRVGDISVHRV